jgi:hypothetical protein
MADTVDCTASFILKTNKNMGGLVMKTVKAENDIAALIELLKMEAEHWPHSRTDEISQGDLFCRDQTLLEMWPEACRRTGVGGREFPPGVIKLWKQSLGHRVN